MAVPDSVEFKVTEKDYFSRSKIEIKPSTEAIPDEYPMGNVLIHIFASKMAESIKTEFSKILTDCGHNIPPENIHNIQTEKDVMDTFKTIATTVHCDNISSLIIGFFGESKEKCSGIFADNQELIEISQIWSSFVFMRMPKLFFLQGLIKLKHETTTDSVCKGDMLYDCPLEADILIMFKTIKLNNYQGSNACEFMKKISDNIRDYAERDDVIDIITNTVSPDRKRPLVLSTLRQKYYFKPSKSRGYHYDVDVAMEELNKLIKKIEKKKTMKVTCPSITVCNTDDNPPKSPRRKNDGSSVRFENAHSNKSDLNRSLPSLHSPTTPTTTTFGRKTSICAKDYRTRSNSLQKAEKKPWKP